MRINWPPTVDAIRHDDAREEIGVAQEGGGEPRRRPFVDRGRHVFLDDAAAVQDGHAIGERQGLLLVVGDEDRGEAAVALDAAQLDLHLLAKPPVQRREGLVEQQNARLRHDGARQGHPLLLPAGELLRTARFETAEMHHLDRPRDLAGRRRPADAAAMQPVGDVLADAHVGKQGVGLEHHADVATPERLAGHILAADHDPARVGRDEALR